MHQFKSLFFLDDQVIIADSEDILQRGAFTLQTQQKVWIGNTPEKSVMTILLAQDPVRCKFIMVNKSL